MAACKFFEHCVIRVFVLIPAWPYSVMSPKLNTPYLHEVRFIRMTGHDPIASC